MRYFSILQTIIDDFSTPKAYSLTIWRHFSHIFDNSTKLFYAKMSENGINNVTLQA